MNLLCEPYACGPDGVLRHTNTEEQDIVVMTVRLMRGPDSGERDLYDANLFTDYEQRLFTRVVALAEKHGKPVDLVVATGLVQKKSAAGGRRI